MEKEEKEITPINGYVIVEFQPFIDRQTKSGIHLVTPKHEGVPNRGRIIAIAKDITEVKVGDYIVYKSPSARGFKLDDRKLIPVHIDEIAGIVNENSH